MNHQVSTSSKPRKTPERSRIARVNDFSPTSQRTQNLLRLHNSAVCQLNPVAMLKLRPQLAFRNTQRSSFVRIKFSRTRFFHKRIRQTRNHMVRPCSLNRILFLTANHASIIYLVDFNWKRQTKLQNLSGAFQKTLYAFST